MTEKEILAEGSPCATWPVMKDGKITGRALVSVDKDYYEKVHKIASKYVDGELRHKAILNELYDYCDRCWSEGGFKISDLQMILEKITKFRGDQG